MGERICWLVFTIMSCALVSLAATLMAYINLYNDSNDIIEITRNWQTKAILDLQVSLDGCPEGYESSSNSKWPGTMSGCWCGEITSDMRRRYNLWSDVYVYSCDYNQTKAGCDDISSTAARPMNIWSTINDTKAILCVQRSTESWIDVANYSGNTCPPGKIKCGLSADNTFCVNNGSKCPINDIEMTSLTLPRDSGILSQCNEANNCSIFAQDPSTAQIIKYKRGDKFDALPTAQFRLSEYGMCKDSTQDDVTPGRSVFTLFGNSKANCGNEGDAFWNKTVFQISEKKLFDLNGISTTIKYLNQYGYYDQGYSGNNYQYYLFSRSYIPWKMECRDQMNVLIQKNDNISNLKDYQSTLMFLSCFFGVVLAAVLPMFISITACLEKVNGKFKMATIVRIIGRLVHFCVRFGMIPLQISSFKSSKSLVGLYSSISQRGCTTSEVSHSLNTMQKSVDIAHYGNIISLAWFAFTTIITLCFFLSDRIRRPNNNKHQLSDSLVYSEPQQSQTQDDETPYFAPNKDYDTQYGKKNPIHQQEPNAQPLQYAPPAPLEDEPMYAKPLYVPFDTKN